MQNLEIEEVEFKNNRLNSTIKKFETGYGVRVIKNKKIGFSASNDIENIEKAFERATEMALYGEKSYFNLPSNSYKNREFFNKFKTIDKINLKDLIEIGYDVLLKLKKIDKDVSININLRKVNLKNEILNSNDLMLSEFKNSLNITASIFKASENNFIEIWDGFVYKEGIQLFKQIKLMIERMKNIYELCKKNAEIEKGLYTVLFTPKAFTIILEMILKSFNGDLIYKNISFFSDKLNKKVFRVPITIIDDPKKKGYPFSYSFDGDGILPRKIFLLRNGVVKDLFLDLQTAGKLKLKTNGHSYRSYSSLPVPSSSNIFFKIEKEDYIKPLDKIIKSIDKGILIDQFLGAGQSNILSGEFSVNIETAFLIKNGKIEGRVKNCMLAGNLFEILNNIEKISDTSVDYFGIESPFVLVKNLNIS